MSKALLAAEAAGLLICFVIPAAGFIILQRKYKKCVRPFLLGALAFTVSQLLLRSMLLNVILPGQAWYLELQVNHYYGYWVFLGLTAGIFEETARFICFHFFLKDETPLAGKRALAFGFGHGGIEAMVLTGTSYLNLLLCSIVVYRGGSLTESLGMPGREADIVLTQLRQMSAPDLLMGGVERISAMMIHLGLTLIVFAAVRAGRRRESPATGKRFGFGYFREAAGVLLAILIHGFADASLGFWQAAGVAGYALEAVIFVYAVLILFLGIYLERR